MSRCGLLLLVTTLAGCGQRELSPIRLERIVTLGAESGDGGFVTTPRLSARNPGGFWIITPAWNGIPVFPLAFADDGKFLGALRGDSPDAARSPAPMFSEFGPGDSIWVFYYPGSARVFDSSRKYVRSFKFASPATDSNPGIGSATILKNGLIAAITSPGSVLTLFEPNGDVHRILSTVDTHGRGAQRPRDVVQAGDGTLWTVQALGPWHMEHWDTGGRLLGELDPTGSWPPNVDRAESEQAPPARFRHVPRPRSVVTGTWFDDAGRLWVASLVSDRRWWTGLLDADLPERRHIEKDKLYDTVIEVRDPGNGNLIASGRFDIGAMGLAGPGVLVHEIVTSAGWVRAELFRVVLDETALRSAKTP